MVIKEIFTSLQGEGANFGMPATFIRFAGCNLACDFCDTDFSSGDTYTLDTLTDAVRKGGVPNIIWTGGEPALQLTPDIVTHFKRLGYRQAIETNGTRPVPEGLDYISCSPKVPVSVLWKHFGETQIGEYRYPVAPGLAVPSIDDLPPASHYFLSPIFTGTTLNGEKNDFSRRNLRLCLDLIRRDPRWRLSVQMHKFLHIQ